MVNLIQCNDICKSFGEKVALDHVSVSMNKGRIFGLLGPNGSGKTTLIRIINRITAPDSGDILFDGHAFQPEDVMNIGYLPEERGLYKKMKVGEQAIYLARLKGLSHEKAKLRLARWFDKFGIMPWWNKKLEELSKGMQQKVQFIITVLHEPQLLIFDEPFSGFDPVNAEMLKKEILELRDKGHTIIFSTHNMSSVEEVCDDIALINHSQVVLSGHVQEVKERFRTGLFEAVSLSELQSADGLFTVEQCEPSSSGLHAYLLQKNPGLTNSELIAAVAQRTELRSICEKMPSMQEIFIRQVEQTSTDNHE